MRFLLSLIFFFPLLVSAQVRVGIFGGISNYMGDIVDNKHILQSTGPAVGLTGSYAVSERFTLRAGFTYGTIHGKDASSKDSARQARNLSFNTSLKELSLVGIYQFFNADLRFSPYVFAGISGFRFNPYAKDSSGGKVYLQPLGTEGQGIPDAPKKYARTAIAIPFGAGLRYSISPRIDLSIETGLRKTFTDYIDDVSTAYPDAQKLGAANGAQAVAFSYRGDELSHGVSSFPAAGSQRGGAKEKDYYAFTGVHLNFRIGGGTRDIKCPKVLP